MKCSSGFTRVGTHAAPETLGQFQQTWAHCGSFTNRDLGPLDSSVHTDLKELLGTGEMRATDLGLVPLAAIKQAASQPMPCPITMSNLPMREH